MDDEGWDLHAVVRGCRITSTSTTATTTTGTVDPFASIAPAIVKEESVATDGNLSFPTRYVPELYGSRRTGLEELEELCKPFICESKPAQAVLLPQQSNCSTSPSFAVVTAAVPPPLTGVQQPQFQPRQPQRPASQVSRSKRRKNQQKRVVCHVPADGLSSDVWAWRKYGQKPIKGSPYPRGYYRCSSSKGCLARKLVERSRTDPETFIITYTAEHNHPAPTHRNSLAGSTRTKFPSSSTSTSTAVGNTSVTGEVEQAASSPLSSPPAGSGLSPTTPLTSSIEDELLGRQSNTQKADDGGGTEEDEEDDEGMLMVEDMEVMGQDELVFMGLDEISGNSTSGGGRSSDLFDDGGFEEHMFAPRWLANNSNSSNNAAAAGGR